MRPSVVIIVKLATLGWDDVFATEKPPSIVNNDYCYSIFSSLTVLLVYSIQILFWYAQSWNQCNAVRPRGFQVASWIGLLQGDLRNSGSPWPIPSPNYYELHASNSQAIAQNSETKPLNWAQNPLLLIYSPGLPFIVLNMSG